jgi:ADP-L-glycero-D-manno-heptose 6-epimerase
MIIVTGGAGFIGSAIIWKLNTRGISDILVTDHLGTSEKWKNLVNLRFYDYMDRDLFIKKLESGDFGNSIDAVIHMGACSATTEKNADYLMENNFHYTVRLAQWAVSNKTRFIYASSAATYGAGEFGYVDSDELMDRLKPLNMYGYSKHLFDKYALRMGWLDRIVGLKFFNVFGPNEYHKGDMRSLVCKSYPLIRDEGKMALYFFDNRDIGGVYNIGTGQGHTWNELAHAIFSACGKKSVINYIDMPEHIREKYQYFTKAELNKLHTSGCLHECQKLEVAIDDYVNNYLKLGRYLGE